MRLLPALLLCAFHLWLRSSLYAEPAPAAPGDVAWARATLQRGGSVYRQQKALGILRAQPSPEDLPLLRALVNALAAGTLAPALWLDVVETARASKDAALLAQVAAWEQRQATLPDATARYAECLEGGDAEEGRRVFAELPQAGCMRCHRVSGDGGTIGPDLTGLDRRGDRIHMLESIVLPSAYVIPGYRHVLLELQNGESLSGVLQFESPEELGVVSVADGSRRTVKVAQVVSRTELPSAMPPGFGEILTRRQLRDVMEYIATSR